MKYQERAAAKALEHAAYALACIALSDFKGAAAHTKAMTAWCTVAVSAAAAIRLGKVRQWMLDAMWVEPLPIYDDVELDDGELPN